MTDRVEDDTENVTEGAAENAPENPTGKPREINDPPMPLLEHLVELRRRLLWSSGAFLICFAISYHFSAQIYGFLAEPLIRILREHGEEPHMIATALYETFFTYIKVAFFSAAFCSFPMVASQVWLFVAPGLYRSEKRALLPFLVATPVLFLMGASLAYYFIFPVAWKFFLSFDNQTGSGPHIEMQAKVSEYLALVMKLIFAFGVAFELPVALTLLARVGIVTSAGLKHYRRYAYVGCFVVAAVLTPPDVITQCGLAFPLLGLYELSIFSAKMVERKRLDEN
jgi:sec-independent protein translocase protein TatC